MQSPEMLRKLSPCTRCRSPLYRILIDFGTRALATDRPDEDVQSAGLATSERCKVAISSQQDLQMESYQPKDIQQNGIEVCPSHFSKLLLVQNLLAGNWRGQVTSVDMAAASDGAQPKVKSFLADYASPRGLLPPVVLLHKDADRGRLEVSCERLLAAGTLSCGTLLHVQRPCPDLCKCFLVLPD